jgi:hypothetical protein
MIGVRDRRSLLSNSSLIDPSAFRVIVVVMLVASGVLDIRNDSRAEMRSDVMGDGHASTDALGSEDNLVLVR